MGEIESIPSLDFSDFARDDLAHLASQSGMLESIATHAAQIKVDAGSSEAEHDIAKNTKLPLDQVHRVFRAIWNLTFLKNRLGLNSQKLIDVIISNLEQQAPQDWIKNNLPSLKSASSTIAKVLDTLNADHPLYIASKAEQLRLSHQNVLTDARIITDLRPVFNPSAKKIAEFIISHNLLVNYYDGTETRRMVFALDANDVANLRRICERAQEKEHTLKSLKSDPSSISIVE
ncbi:MAG: hypothetical protein ABSG67_06845 [Thermoguttaceae bacterium]|jgi:hypothetical protein